MTVAGDHGAAGARVLHNAGVIPVVTPDEMAAIDALDAGNRVGGHPDTVN